MARVVSIEEAEGHLREILEQVRDGQDEVVIADNGTPLARLTALTYAAGAPRVPGCDAGLIWMAPDFEAPLPDDIIEAFYQ